jgi:hypothetical protein
MVETRLINARRRFYSVFSPEIKHLKAFINEYPFLSLSLPFFLGLILGGILKATVSQFVIITLIGGFPIAGVYGLSIGLPVYVSNLLAIPVLLFASYAAVRILWVIDKYPRATQYLAKLKKRYEAGATYLAVHAGRIGLAGALALCTFLVGWWVAIIISYVLNVDVKTTMKAVIIGLLIGAGFSQISYEGLVKWLPDPLIVTAILLAIFVLIARIIGILAKREATSVS